MHAAMLNNINSKDRGLFKSKFYVINHTSAPAVLLEIGFISNPQERSQLVTESRKNSTAKAIAEGIDAYFK
jgi:N-acetylmuramoyl-L-alanine amidase